MRGQCSELRFPWFLLRVLVWCRFPIFVGRFVFLLLEIRTQAYLPLKIRLQLMRELPLASYQRQAATRPFPVLVLSRDTMDLMKHQQERVAYLPALIFTISKLPTLMTFAEAIQQDPDNRC